MMHKILILFTWVSSIKSYTMSTVGEGLPPCVWWRHGTRCVLSRAQTVRKQFCATKPHKFARKLQNFAEISGQRFAVNILFATTMLRFNVWWQRWQCSHLSNNAGELSWSCPCTVPSRYGPTLGLVAFQWLVCVFAHEAPMAAILAQIFQKFPEYFCGHHMYAWPIECLPNRVGWPDGLVWVWLQLSSVARTDVLRFRIEWSDGMDIIDGSGIGLSVGDVGWWCGMLMSCCLHRLCRLRLFVNSFWMYNNRVGTIVL